MKPQLRDRQETSRSRGRGDDRPTPMAWGWSLYATSDLRIERKEHILRRRREQGQQMDYRRKNVREVYGR